MDRFSETLGSPFKITRAVPDTSLRKSKSKDRGSPMNQTQQVNLKNDLKAEESRLKNDMRSRISFGVLN